MPEKSSSLPRRGKTQSPLSRLAAWPAAVANLVRYALRRIREDRIAEAAGSLTFTTILAMVPLLIVIFALLTPFPVFDQMRETLHDLLLDNLVPPALSETILGYLNLYASKATNLTLFGLLGLGFTSLALILTIDHTLNTIWRVRRPRHLAQRLLIYIAVLTIGPVLLAASLGLTSYMFTLSGLGWRLRHRCALPPTGCRRCLVCSLLRRSIVLCRIDGLPGAMRLSARWRQRSPLNWPSVLLPFTCRTLRSIRLFTARWR